MLLNRLILDSLKEEKKRFNKHIYLIKIYYSESIASFKEKYVRLIYRKDSLNDGSYDTFISNECEELRNRLFGNDI
jgi:hypothetical protein